MFWWHFYGELCSLFSYPRSLNVCTPSFVVFTKIIVGFGRKLWGCQVCLCVFVATYKMKYFVVNRFSSEGYSRWSPFPQKKRNKTFHPESRRSRDVDAGDKKRIGQKNCRHLTTEEALMWNFTTCCPVDWCSYYTFWSDVRLGYWFFLRVL